MEIKIILNADQQREIAHDYLRTIMGEKKASGVTGAGSMKAFVEAQPEGTMFNTRDLAGQFKINGHKAARTLVALGDRRQVRMVRKGQWKRI